MHEGIHYFDLVPVFLVPAKVKRDCFEIPAKPVCPLASTVKCP